MTNNKKFMISSIFTMYGMASIAMTLINKELSACFPYFLTTIFVQNFGAMICSLTLLALNLDKAKPFQMKHLRPSLINSLWLIVNLWLSLKTLQLISVPLYVVASYTRPLATALIEFLCLRRKISLEKVMALGLVVLGITWYIVNEKNHNFRGFFFALLNTLMVSGLSVYENVVMNELKKEQTPLGVNLYRLAFSSPILLLLIAKTENISQIMQVNGGVIIMLGISSVCCLLLGVLMFALQPLVNAASIQLGNVFFKFLTTVFGHFMSPISAQGWIGYTICMIGFLIYGFEPFKNQQKPKTT